MGYTYFGGLVGDFGLTMIIFFGSMAVVLFFIWLEKKLRGDEKK